MFWKLFVLLDAKEINKLFISYKHKLCMDLKANTGDVKIPNAALCIGNSLFCSHDSVTEQTCLHDKLQKPSFKGENCEGL